MAHDQMGRTAHFPRASLGSVEAMDGPALHPDLEPLAFLLGDWAGEGEGSYPSGIADFAYREETRLWHGGKPVILYMQRTVDRVSGEPRHTEMGYLRPVGPEGVELVVAHPSGHAEVAAGTVAGSTIELASTTVAATATAKSVTALSRRLVADGDTLTYDLAMAAVGHPLTHHLAATLHRS